MPPPTTEVAVRASLDAVDRATVATLTRDQLAEHLGHLRVIRSWADAAELLANRRARELAAAGKAGSAEAAHVRAGQRAEREARAISARADLCEQMPGFETALASGTVSAGHVDAMARTAGKLDEAGRTRLQARAEQYLDQATRSSVDAFERAMRTEATAINAATAGDTAAEELASQRRRSNVKRWVDRQSGMHHTHIELDPVRDLEMWTTIDQQLAADRSVDGNAQTPWSELRVQAVVNATKALGGGNSRPEINVLIDFETLRGRGEDAGLLSGRSIGHSDRGAGTSDDGASAAVPTGRPSGNTSPGDPSGLGSRRAAVCEGIDGTPLPVATVRRMCCDAEVLPTVLGGDGEVLDAGRTRRTATRSQRRALAAMHRSCGHPDCTVGFEATRIHHVEFWTEHLGPTDLDNLLPLCERHHHDVHEGGWRLTMTPDRVATWRRPDGSHHHTGSTIDRTTRRKGDPCETGRVEGGAPAFA